MISASNTSTNAGMIDNYGGTGEDVQAPGIAASLPSIIWQRRWLIFVPAMLIALAALAAAFLFPRSYQARAVLLVESQNLPDAQPSQGQVDPIDRRIAGIRQQILSRPNLVELIQANDLYDASRRSEPLSTLVERMRKATDISAVNADIQANPGGSNSGSIAFSLTFNYPQAGPAQAVAQTFVDKLLKLDATQTQADAQTNINYLQDQQNDLQGQISQIETKMRQIAGANGAALSSAGSITMTGAGIDYAGQIATLQRENAQMSAQASTATDRDPNVVSAEAALTAAQATYSDNHPDVLLAKKRLEIARANATGLSSRNLSTAVRQQIAANNAAIGELNRQRASEQSRVASMAAAQARGPAAQQAVQQLQARAEMLRTNLARVSTSLLTARSVSKVGDGQRGERLTLIEPPVTPDHPTSPNRPVLIVGGIVGGIVFGLALAMLIELVRRPIRSAAQLVNILGEPPLAVVPVLTAKTPARFGGWFRRKSSPARAASAP